MPTSPTSSFDVDQSPNTGVDYCGSSIPPLKASTMKSASSKTTTIDIGISVTHRKKIAQGLSVLLADSYTLYLMTHNFHWNVTGPQFNSLHNMFLQQYTEQWTALGLDRRAYSGAWGLQHPGPTKNLSKLATIQGGRRCAQGQRHDSPFGRCAGGGCPHGAKDVLLWSMPRTINPRQMC